MPTNLISKKHFLTVPFIILFLTTTLVACGNQEDSAEKSDVKIKDEITSTNLATENDSKNVPLSQDIDSLLSEKNINLSISQHDSTFIPATTSFSQQIINLLRSHGDAVGKVSDIDNYDLVLKFAGYEDIHLNFDTNSFWFAGDDQLYRFHVDFKNQWNRYMIRVVDGKLMYDAFEKSVLKTVFFTGQNGTEHKATLFYDGDIRLRFDNSEVAVDSNVREKSLSFNHSSVPLSSYSMHMFGEQPFIAVVNNFSTVHGPNAKLDLFTYKKQDIQNVFSTSDLTLEIEAIDLEKGEVEISIPFAHTTATYFLTKEEKAHTEAKMSKYEKTADEFIKSFRNGISFTPIEVAFKDTDNDGIEEIIISTNIHTIGANTPLSINTNATFEFEIMDQGIQLKEVTFDKQPNK